MLRFLFMRVYIGAAPHKTLPPGACCLINQTLMIKQLITIIAVLLAVVFNGCSKPDKYTGVIFNHQNNKPLKGVWVINYPDSTITDSMGHFSLPFNGHAGPLLFKIAGFYPDSAQTYVNHSGEQLEQLTDLGKIYLFPINGRFRNLTEALKAAEPKPIDTAEVYNYTRDKKFYTRKAGESEFLLVIPKGFTPHKYVDPIIPVKGSDYKYDIATGDTFLKAAKLNLNRVPCRLLVYSTLGENDTRVLNIQLNSYDYGFSFGANRLLYLQPGNGTSMGGHVSSICP